MIERSSILEDGEQVTSTHLPADMLAGQHASAADAQAAIVLPPEGIPLDVVEVELPVRPCREPAATSRGRRSCWIFPATSSATS